MRRRHRTFPLLVLVLALAGLPVAAAGARPLPEAGEPIAEPAAPVAGAEAGPAIDAAPAPTATRAPSRAIGRPTRGRLRGGVPMPPLSDYHLTWDPILETSPSRLWRRWGTDRTVSRTLRVLYDFHQAHPDLPPVLVGDLSRPGGGDFGARIGGGLGHASHQNGLDVDVYYVRRDRQLRAPTRPAQVDRALAQELVDRFVAAGAVHVFVGPRLHLRHEPAGVVQPLVHHDDHLHVRWAP